MTTTAASTDEQSLGLIRNLMEPEYNQLEGFRSSMFKHLRRSPAHLAHHLANPQEPTDAMVIGQLLHHALLVGPHDGLCVILPEDYDGRSAAGKAIASAAKEAGKIPLKHKDHQMILGIKEAVLSNPENREALAGGYKEVSMRQQCFLPLTGRQVLCKARFDHLPHGDFFIDVKTVQDASANAFSRTAWNFMYHLQAFHYMQVYQAVREAARAENVTRLLDGILQERSSFMFIAVEREPPHASNRFLLSEKFYSYARNQWEELLTLYLKCVDQGYWPAYPETMIVIDPPRWVDSDSAVEIL